VQLTDQVQRINTKLQASLTTLSQASPSAGAAATDANGSSTSSNGNTAAGTDAAAAAAPRGKIEKMSAEVVDSNPYSRLMALQRMGIVQDYEKIRGKTVSPKRESVGGGVDTGSTWVHAC
jgi:ubiquitin-like modifier-activating enzyme 5